MRTLVRHPLHTRRPLEIANSLIGEGVSQLLFTPEWQPAIVIVVRLLRLDIRVLGLVSIDPDVAPALARATIASISVLGAFQASADIKAALADRTA